MTRLTMLDRFKAFDEPGVLMDMATGLFYETRQDALAAVVKGEAHARDIITGSREVLGRIRDTMIVKAHVALRHHHDE